MPESWKQLNSQADVEKLLDLFGEFHDGCMKELYLWTGHHVRDDLAMAVSPGLDNSLRVLFQRQFSDPSAIELFFEELLGLLLDPTPENHDSIIAAAGFVFEGGIFKFETDTISIQSRKVAWRDASNWMGPTSRYGPGCESADLRGKSV